mmetsp:Transcript_22939/g.32790  ORF Transcript_22939/g.32790 Transcript_22939/m.32790 type:complete len:436 (+) Transcript_22939:165-1472(+)|eukprot:CAMPEP_0201690000 /NCGR_PEP_ID=MMETSP0578-20130828/3515_1 /ASSEMBLY_ACC=CAM_ASM_000663 /TAXON_ID=267565 /ORGANISM="Skeletonema grethea, Strain CCMP 1804" /LENGTH=435 /DNA_ID=CAMNT_0048174845 /DNA_START=75 /DNA_END=1382 /DNA_ORIENTATION=+
MSESSWKLKQPKPKPLCSSSKTSDKRGTPAQWDVIKGGVGENISRSFNVYIPPNFCSTFSVGETTVASVPLRIILAFHGYGGRPAQEIQKWQDVADDLNAIIIAPMGTETIETHKLGWNAVECCGDPVLKDIDDLDFVLYGVMEIFLNQFGASRGSSIGYNDNSNGKNAKQVHVIATGFSNGGFFTSLLGILDDRPEWLVGIVPTGGYQYDINAYSSTPALAVFMHHGGKDSVVNPNGCCLANESKQRKKGSKSNCMFDIGVKQETCQSAQSVYHLWSSINGCSSDHHDGRNIKEGSVNSVESECFVGKDCIEPTNFCVWTNEGHSWGGTFPGMEMMGPWMVDVFLRAEKKRFEQRDADELATPYHRVRVGKSIFLSASSILLGIIALSAAYKSWNFKRTSGKRKSSEDWQVSREEEMTVLCQEDEIERHTVSVP